MTTEISTEIDEKKNAKIGIIKVYWRIKSIWIFRVETKEIDFNANLNGIMVVELLMLKPLQIVLFEALQVDLQATLTNLQVEHDHPKELREKIEIFVHVMIFANGNRIKISKGIVIECLDSGMN